MSLSLPTCTVMASSTPGTTSDVTRPEPDGDTIVRARYDGTYDKTNLPDELVMSSSFSVRDGKS